MSITVQSLHLSEFTPRNNTAHSCTLLSLAATKLTLQPEDHHHQPYNTHQIHRTQTTRIHQKPNKELPSTCRVNREIVAVRPSPSSAPPPPPPPARPARPRRSRRRRLAAPAVARSLATPPLFPRTRWLRRRSPRQALPPRRRPPPHDVLACSSPSSRCWWWIVSRCCRVWRRRGCGALWVSRPPAGAP
jgi:hypothetical protein